MRPRLSRRSFFRAGAGTLAGVLAGGGAPAAANERFEPVVRRVALPIPGLPAGLHGLTLCQLSDLHRGPLVPESFLRAAVATVVALRPEAVVLTGDFVSDSARHAASCAAALSALHAPLGVFAVRGNHDHWTGDPEAIDHALTQVGIRMLNNRGVPLRRRGATLWLCGVDDIWSGRPDLDAALDGAPAGAPRVLLCHEPDFADTAASRGIALQLSGHSHGGQVLLPNARPLVTPPYGRKYPVGLRRVPGAACHVYTNVGLGVIFPPIRVNCPPEITLLTLLSA